MKRWFVAMAVALTTVAVAQVPAQKELANEREKTSYMIGMDVGQSLQPLAPDLDLASFEKAFNGAMKGDVPQLQGEQAKETAIALMRRVQARKDGTTANVPPVARDKAGLMMGADVGGNLAPLRDELDNATFMRGLRVVLENGKPLLAKEERDALKLSLAQRMQAKAANQAQHNLEEGNAFMLKNKTNKGVFSTRSGLQYQVLRQGAGIRPMPTDTVKVNYEGRLLDGKVFDSSYQRGEAASFQLNRVIPGWTEGVGLMPVGAKYRFWIPGSLAYGVKGSPPTIGPNQTLVFDVELMEVAK